MSNTQFCYIWTFSLKNYSLFGNYHSCYIIQVNKKKISYLLLVILTINYYQLQNHNLIESLSFYYGLIENILNSK